MASLFVYQLLPGGLIVGCAWAFAAYGAAFRATRRQVYRKRALVWLGIVVAYTIIAAVIAPAYVPQSVLPFMFPAIVPFARCFSATRDKEMTEYRSSRAIMLFQPPINL